MNHLLISIIVPCYNVEEYLKDCVESVLNQTYPHWELILVNDGSKDNTAEICDRYAREDNRIKVIHKENGGLVSARNAGYKAVTGEWHTYIDGDDWIEHNQCEVLVKHINEQKGIDVIFWKYVQELGGSSIKGKIEWKSKDKTHFYTNDECKDLARHALIYDSGIATAPCKLINTAYSKEYKILHDSSLKQGAEGLEFSTRCFYNAKKALFLNEYFYHYRYNPISISKVIDEKNTQHITDCFNVINTNIQKFENTAIYQEALNQRICYALIAMAMSTYFHPNNSDKLWIKIKKYNKVIINTAIYKKAIKECDTKGMDKLRKITLFFIRTKLYFMLHFIATTKQFFLKKGKFNY